jgi:hypothetical protein
MAMFSEEERSVVEVRDPVPEEVVDVGVATCSASFLQDTATTANDKGKLIKHSFHKVCVLTVKPQILNILNEYRQQPIRFY